MSDKEKVKEETTLNNKTNDKKMDRKEEIDSFLEEVEETDAALSLDAALEEVLAAPAEEVETTISTAPVAEEESGAKKAVNDFIDRQKRLLVGKTLQKDLVNADGGVILNAGDTVSDDIIDFLRRIDRKFLIRLAECVV